MNDMMSATTSDVPADWKPVLPHASADATATNSLRDAPTPGQPDPKAPWEKACDAFVIVDGLAQALAQLILKGKIPISKPDLKDDLVAALYALNTGLHNVSIAFKDYIDNGTPFTIEPPSVDTWPDPNAHVPADFGYFESGFEVIAGTLSMLSKSIEDKLAAHPDAQAAFDALVVLVNGKDALLDKVKAVLNELHPA